MDFSIKKEGEFQYLEEGEGSVLILLHGLFGALSNWADVINHFSKNYRVVIPLMPIYDLPLLSTNVKELAEFVHRFIEFKNYKTLNLIGNSLGGHVALVYITNHPDKVKTLTLTGSSGLYENAMGGSFPRREDYNFIKSKIELTFYDPKAATKELVDEVYEIINNKGKLVRIISLAKSAIRHNMADELQNIKAPSCLIWGKNDTITPPEVAEEFHSLLPNSDLFFIDKCGHAPMMEHSGQFNEILDRWLGAHQLS
jgi:pimeloyl-ACP methyl ester carboxylesterase